MMEVYAFTLVCTHAFKDLSVAGKGTPSRAQNWALIQKHTDWNRPPWPGTIVTICMSCFMTGDPDKE